MIPSPTAYKPRKRQQGRPQTLFQKLFSVFFYYFVVIVFFGFAFALAYLNDPDNFIYQEQVREKKFRDVFEERREWLEKAILERSHKIPDTIKHPEYFQNLKRPMTTVVIGNDTLRGNNTKLLLHKLKLLYDKEMANYDRDREYRFILKHDTVVARDSVVWGNEMKKWYLLRQRDIRRRVTNDSIRQVKAILRQYPDTIFIPAKGVMYLMGKDTVYFADTTDLETKWREYILFGERNKIVPVWNLFDFMYFSTLCITGGGYGDIIPNSTLTRVLIVSEIGIGAFLLIVVLNYVVTDIENKRQQLVKKRKTRVEAPTGIMLALKRTLRKLLS